MEREYLYDGSLVHLYTLFFDLYREQRPRIQKEGRLSLFPQVYSTPDPEKYRRVFLYLKKQGGSVARDFLLVFHSEDDGKEEAMFRVFQLLEKHGAYSKNSSEEEAKKFFSLARKVARERHAYLGLLRFTPLEDQVLYAPFEPQANLLPLLIPHFQRRLGDEPFILHDVGRNLLCEVRGKSLNFQEVEKWEISLPQEDRRKEEWKTFYDHIGIPERRNLLLRQGNMPKRYWAYLTELEGKDLFHE